MISPLKDENISLADWSAGIMYKLFVIDLQINSRERAYYHWGKCEVYCQMIDPDLAWEVHEALLNEANRF